jgi:H+/Cl- antiporter ClcA
MTSYQISYSLGIRYFYRPISFVPVFSETFFIKVALAGIFFGICSFLLVEMLKSGKKLSERLSFWMPLKGLIGGFILVGLALIFSKQYLGLGLETIQSSLQGGRNVWYAFILKIIFTSITLNFGGSGGIVTPIFFVGATSGTFFAEIMRLDIATFSAIGLVSLLAGAANTPIAASIMAVELFGPKVAPYAAVACVISFLMTGHRSVYSSQVLAVAKSASFHVEIGKELEEVEAKFQVRDKGLIHAGLRITQVIKEIMKKKKKER